MANYPTNYCGQCTSKTSKNGKTTYSHNVLEAKLVTHNGMSVSIATEWVRNENGKEYVKQDCEFNAFKCLAVKLKKKDAPTSPTCQSISGEIGVHANGGHLLRNIQVNR